MKLPEQDSWTEHTRWGAWLREYQAIRAREAAREAAKLAAKEKKA